MDIHFIKQYIGENCKIVLANKFYYFCKIINCDNNLVQIIDRTGHKILIEPNSIILLEVCK